MEHQDGDGLLLVEAYGNGGFRFLGKRVEGSVLVTESGFFPLDIETVSDLTQAHFDRFGDTDDKPEIVLIGTGEKMTLLPADLRKSLVKAGIGFEVMDTGAAARTYNVLRMEDRRVVAFLVHID